MARDAAHRIRNAKNTIGLVKLSTWNMPAKKVPIKAAPAIDFTGILVANRKLRYAIKNIATINMVPK